LLLEVIDTRQELFLVRNDFRRLLALDVAPGA
jgi:hypothetical protein